MHRRSQGDAIHYRVGQPLLGDSLTLSGNLCSRQTLLKASHQKLNGTPLQSSQDNRKIPGWHQGWPRRMQPPDTPREPHNEILLYQEPAIHCIVMCCDSSHICSQGGGWQPMLQPFLQERKHYSNRTSLCVFSTRIKTVNEQTPKLTGVNIYLLKAQGQLYVRAEGALVRESYNWQWEDSWEATRFTWVSPRRLQNSRIISEWSRHSPWNVSCRESTSAAWLRMWMSRMWTVRSNLHCIWLQRKRWRVNFDMRCNRRQPCQLMYEMVAVFTMRTNTS